MIDPVVSLSLWQQHRDDVVLADVRWYLDGRSGQDAYDAGHLPGAVFVDLDQWLAGEPSAADGRHPLPSPALFAGGMARLGISDGDVVIAYDDAGGTTAARLVWMLRATGRQAALLDGGITAYTGPLETGAPARPPAPFTPRPWPDDYLASIDEAAAGNATAGNVVVDARDRARFRGDTEPVDPRPGHIPGARSLPCRENLAADGTFLPVPQLRQKLADAGVTDGTAVISYCGSGVTACHNLLMIEHAGLGRGRLYPGSWSQYSHTTRPAATGDA